MLEPLQQWICDYCGEIINSPDEGWLEWISEKINEQFVRKAFGFRIVHHRPFSPIEGNENGGCYHYSKKQLPAGISLRDFVGPKGVPNLLTFLDVGPYHSLEYRGPGVKDIREYVELVRRLTIPYYEEALLYWGEAMSQGYFDSANEVWIYLPENLKELVKRYGKD